MDWFTSDTHFGHTNCIKYDQRPFSNTEEMDNKIIQNINNLVAPKDTLYHLGDFSFASLYKTIEYRERINCKNLILCFGNHDRKLKKRQEFLKLFSRTDELIFYKNKHIEIVLCHFALRTWPKSHHRSFHLYGHSHGKLFEEFRYLSFDVGVCCWDYKPLSLDAVIKIMEKKKWVKSLL